MEQTIKDYFKQHMLGTIKDIVPMQNWEQGKRYCVVLRFITTRSFLVYEKDNQIIAIKEYHNDKGFRSIFP